MDDLFDCDCGGGGNIPLSCEITTEPPDEPCWYHECDCSCGEVLIE